MKRAVFPGSFDPITRGHEALVLKALPLFDEIIVSIGNNSQKNYFFDAERRKAWIAFVFRHHPKVKVADYNGLTVDFCKQVDAQFILRGLRTSADFEFERSIGQVNKMMVPEVETVFFLTSPEFSPITSSIIRDIFKNGGDVSAFIPEGIDLTI